MKEIKFALYAIKKNIKNNTELRTSFLMNIIGMAINNIAFIVLWVYFVKSVGIIGGWTTFDVIGLQGFTALSYGIIFSVAMGVRKLPGYITSGAFDNFMLSPKNLITRIATSIFSVSALGDILFGLICIIIYGFLIHVSLMQSIFILILVFLSAIIFFSVSLLIQSINFYFVDAESITEGAFGLFFTPSLFHGGAFQGMTRFIFTFIIPSLLIGAIPIEIVKSISITKLLFLIIFTFFWLFVSIKFFNHSVKKYESSNFMTFGQ